MMTVSLCGCAEDNRKEVVNTTQTATEQFIVNTTEAKTEEKTEQSVEGTTEAKTEEKAEQSVEGTTEGKTEAKTEQRVEGTTEAKTEQSIESTTEAKTEAKTEQSVESTAEAKTESKTESSTEPKTESRTEIKTESATQNTEAATKPASQEEFDYKEFISDYLGMWYGMGIIPGKGISANIEEQEDGLSINIMVFYGMSYSRKWELKGVVDEKEKSIKYTGISYNFNSSYGAEGGIQGEIDESMRGEFYIKDDFLYWNDYVEHIAEDFYFKR